jgi:hypothetical protein
MKRADWRPLLPRSRSLDDRRLSLLSARCYANEIALVKWRPVLKKKTINHLPCKIFVKMTSRHSLSPSRALHDGFIFTSVSGENVQKLQSDLTDLSTYTQRRRIRKQMTLLIVLIVDVSLPICTYHLLASDHDLAGSSASLSGYPNAVSNR